MGRRPRSAPKRFCEIYISVRADAGGQRLARLATVFDLKIADIVHLLALWANLNTGAKAWMQMRHPYFQRGLDWSGLTPLQTC